VLHHIPMMFNKILTPPNSSLQPLLGSWSQFAWPIVKTGNLLPGELFIPQYGSPWKPTSAEPYLLNKEHRANLFYRIRSHELVEPNVRLIFQKIIRSFVWRVY